jgi:hypothetical protein
VKLIQQRHGSLPSQVTRRPEATFLFPSLRTRREGKDTAAFLRYNPAGEERFQGDLRIARQPALIFKVLP